MLLKIGELAKRTGLSVRALHHYDAIGLLSPSLRTPGGARLYGKDDLVRLHRIEALKQFACSLPDVQTALDCPEGPLEILRRQIEELHAQASRAHFLGQHLQRLVDLMTAGGETATSDWLNILELMNMYQRHLNNDEVDALLSYGEGGVSQTDQCWTTLAGEIRQAMEQGVSTDSAQSHDLGWRWLGLLMQMTRNDPTLAGKLINLQLSEPRAQDILGITTSMLAWVAESLALARCALFAKHLSRDDVEEVRRRQLAHTADLTRWPAMVAELRAQLLAGANADAEPVREIIKRWQTYFRDSHCGTDAGLEARVRAAFLSEPLLQTGIGVDESLTAYVQRAEAAHSVSTPDRAGPKPSAAMVAMQRAAHQLLERPLVLHDPLALSIIGSDEAEKLRDELDTFRHPSAVGMRSAVVVRSRLANDQWLEAMKRGVRQCVILGAGLDTSAYGPGHHPGATAFEVDLPATQAWKLARLSEAGIPIPDSLHHVSVDFEGSDIGERLASAGFDPRAPAFFVWLGVTMYLEESAVFNLLRFIGNCAPGSEVLFDYMLPLETLSPVLRIGLQQLMERLAAQGEPWRSFFEPDRLVERLPMLGLANGYSWTPDELNERYLSRRNDGLHLGAGPGRLMLAVVPPHL